MGVSATKTGDAVRGGGVDGSNDARAPLLVELAWSGEQLHAGTAWSTCIIDAIHVAASYRTSRVCDHVSCVCGRDSHACVRDMQAKTEVVCTESDEAVASASTPAAIIKEK